MLSQFWRKMKRKTLSYFYAYLGKYLLRVLLLSCKVEIDGLEEFKILASKQRCILMLWHNRLALIAEILHRYAPQFIYAAFISKSKDAEPLAILARSYKSGKAIRVPHNARHQALKKVISHLKQSHEILVITPDGPRGPRYIVKPGVALAAKEADATIIPFTWKASHYWELNTWDGLMLPKPFSKIYVTLGKPIKIEKENHPLESLTQYLQQELQALQS